VAASGRPGFVVCVLAYGDHPDLAGRCLGGLAGGLGLWVTEVRVGLNAVGAATRARLAAFAAAAPVPVVAYEEERGANVLKYPLMRRMFYDPARPLSAPVMWFDDDSFVTGGRGFWEAAWRAFASGGCPVMGSLYVPARAWTPTERAALATRPWYGGVALDPPPRFATGGWWVADPGFLAAWDYPFRELRHNGGDVLLGELVRQQGRCLKHFRDGVAVNADRHGRESRAPRRGVTTPGPYERPPPYDYAHHDFRVTVRVLNGPAAAGTDAKGGAT